MLTILPENEATWSAAADAVKRGALIVFPTDTVYGVGCDPYNVHALDAIYVAKGRPQEKAVPLLLAGSGVLSIVAGELSRPAKLLGERFWPGALTLVVERSKSLPEQLGRGTTIAVRVPAHDGLRSLIAECGGAIAATSANLSGQPDALDVHQAIAYLGDSVLLYVDGGHSRGSRPSTVVDCTANPVRIVREGHISAADIRACIGH